MNRLHFSNFNLAGFTYWEGAVVFCQLKVGSLLRFERELDNRYDPKAIAIYFNKYKLGYIPRSCNEEIAKLCEQGYSRIFDVRINRISADMSPEDQIGVVVHIKNKDILKND
ncbi:MAG: HIRAN domain-containing protein [Bacteroidales bacterium]